MGHLAGGIKIQPLCSSNVHRVLIGAHLSILSHVIPNMIDSVIILAITHAEPGYDMNLQIIIYGGLVTEAGFLYDAMDILV